MPDPIGLSWVFAGVLAVLIAVALFDGVRRLRSRRKTSPDQRPLAQDRSGGAHLSDDEGGPCDRPAARAATRSASAGEPGSNGKAQSEAGDAPERKTDERQAWSASRIPPAPVPMVGELPRARAPTNVTRDTSAAKPGKGLRIAEDAEFLPAALEILETPPSPAATALMLGICGGLLAVLLWSVIGTLDIHAVAQGKIQPSGRTKVVQPMEPGRVAAILVESGKLVGEGDVLIELDPTETAADLEALVREHESTTAEALRRQAAIASVRSADIAPPSINFPASVGAQVRRRETELLAAELAQTRSVIEGVKAQIAEKEAT
jgi:hypothetical protein